MCDMNYIRFDFHLGVSVVDVMVAHDVLAPNIITKPTNETFQQCESFVLQEEAEHQPTNTHT